LFKTVAETIFVNLLISILYILTFYVGRLNFSFLLDTNFSVSLILIWLVILMTWFIVAIITKQKMELLEVHDRLLRADNLSRVGELAAGVAHEINNPIGIIAATAEYLKMKLPAGDELLEEIDAIHKEAMRCKDIVQEMLTYANPRPAGTAQIEPQSLNDEVLHFVFPKNRSGRFEVIRQYDTDPPIFLADPNLVKQALLNLYINAKQAVPDGSPGRIVSRVLSQGRGRKVCFEVEDNGGGIASDDMEHIFEPFFTRKAHGTGLGLAVTQQIVEKFGGTISVRAANGGGSIFTVTFPASEA
jgi:signal transduction histidine kinase